MYGLPPKVRVCDSCKRLEDQDHALSMKTQRQVHGAAQIAGFSVTPPKPPMRVPMPTSVEEQHAFASLGAYTTSHLEYIMRHLLLAADPSLVAHSAWEEYLLELVSAVVAAVDPYVEAGDSMNILDYIKIKVIPGGPILTAAVGRSNRRYGTGVCEYIDGIVFRKAVPHRKMASAIEKPRVLLLNCE